MNFVIKFSPKSWPERYPRPGPYLITVQDQNQGCMVYFKLPEDRLRMMVCFVILVTG